MRDVPRYGRPLKYLNDNTKLNLLLSFEVNPHVTTTEIALQENVSQSFMVKFFFGIVNQLNYRFWAPEQPHWVQASHIQRPQKINVCVALIKRTFIGPHFFTEI